MRGTTTRRRRLSRKRLYYDSIRSTRNSLPLPPPPTESRISIPMSAASSSRTCYSISLNVGGIAFRALKSRLLRYPDTLLGLFASSDDPTSFCDEIFTDGQGNTHYFFDRPWESFSSILNLYRDNEVHCPENLNCPNKFLRELNYWRIPRSAIAECCNSKLPKEPLDNNVGNHVAQDILDLSCTLLKVPSGTALSEVGSQDAEKNEKDYQISSWEANRRKLDQFLNDPSSSRAAGLFVIVSIAFVLVTVMALILGSIPYFQEVDTQYNATQAVWEIEVTDSVCVVYFTLEYLVRLVAAENRCAYIRNVFSVVDFLAILPFYVEMIFTHAGVQNDTLHNFKRTMIVMRILRVLRVLRVLRIFKVARYSSGFQSFVGAFVKGWRELSMMGMFVTCITILFSTIIYFAENEEPDTKFYSIPQAAWWCIITMTTVGYGDLYPVTVVGKLVASMASITGIILLAFPISIVVDNFNELNMTGQRNEQDNDGSEVVKVVHSKFGAARIRRKSSVPSHISRDFQ